MECSLFLCSRTLIVNSSTQLPESISTVHSERERLKAGGHNAYFDFKTFDFKDTNLNQGNAERRQRLPLIQSSDCIPLQDTSPHLQTPKSLKWGKFQQPGWVDQGKKL